MKGEDGYIIGKCLNGDHDAFGLLVDKYKAGVHALAYSRLRNFHDAQDVTQDAFIMAYKKLHTLKQWDSFIGWMYRITIRLCSRWLENKYRRPDREYIEDSSPDLLDSHTMETYQEEQAFASIHEALDSLSQEHREVIILHYFGGMQSDDIAEFTCASPSAIRQRLTRARLSLKEELIGTISETFKKQKLQAKFTFDILEKTRNIRVQPISREFLTHLGSSVLGIFALAVLGTSMNLMIEREPHNASVTHKIMGVTGSGYIPVYATDEPIVKSGGGRGSLSGNAISVSIPANNVLSTLPTKTQNLWSKYPANPILVPGPEAWDSDRLDSPTILSDGKRYKMWYSGYDGEYWRICYATSPDGLTWDKYANPVIDVDPNTIKEGVMYPSVVFDDSLYRMWYTSNWSIYYATSKDGIHWEKYPENPVLTKSIGEWDDQKAEDCTVIFKDGEYKMWYGGAKEEPVNKANIGYATSFDGIHWDKHPENPVLSTGESGTWDDSEVASPHVLFNGNSYEMWYIGFSYMRGITYRVGYATSKDGIHWQKSPDNPVFDVGAGDKWDNFGVYCPFIMYDNGGYKMWYGGSDKASKSIGYATIKLPKQKNTIKNADKAKVAPVKVSGPPNKTLLLTPFPNPANPGVWIPYKLSEDANVVIRIYTDSGQLVRMLELGYKLTGIYSSNTKSAYWDGRNQVGESVKNGVYFCSFQADRYIDTCKVVIAK